MSIASKRMCLFSTMDRAVLSVPRELEVTASQSQEGGGGGKGRAGAERKVRKED